MAKTCLRVLFCIVNIIYVTIASGIVYGVVYFSNEIQNLKDYRNYERYQLDYEIYWPQAVSWVYGIAACFTILVALVGLSGAIFNSRGVIYTYITLTVIAVVALGGAGTTAVLQSELMEKQLNETVLDVFLHSFEKEDVRKEFGKLEQHLRCCGAESQNLYISKGGLPNSCCDDGVKCSYTKRSGCMVVVVKHTKWAVLWANVAGCGILFLYFVSLIVAVSLVMCRKKTKQISNDKGYEAGYE